MIGRYLDLVSFLEYGFTLQHLESRLLCFGFLNVGCFSFQLSSLQASMLQLLVVSLLLKLC